MGGRAARGPHDIADAGRLIRLMARDRFRRLTTSRPSIFINLILAISYYARCSPDIRSPRFTPYRYLGRQDRQRSIPRFITLRCVYDDASAISTHRMPHSTAGQADDSLLSLIGAGRLIATGAYRGRLLVTSSAAGARRRTRGYDELIRRDYDEAGADYLHALLADAAAEPGGLSQMLAAGHRPTDISTGFWQGKSLF